VAPLPKGNLLLDSTTNSFDALVNVPSDDSSPFLRVVPNNTADSYLIKKLEGSFSTDPDVVGGQMPLGGDALSLDAINLVKTWINQGALVGDPVVASAKVSQFEVNRKPTASSISLRFNRPLLRVKSPAFRRVAFS
jgi:hypothetical protein